MTDLETGFISIREKKNCRDYIRHFGSRTMIRTDVYNQQTGEVRHWYSRPFYVQVPATITKIRFFESFITPGRVGLQINFRDFQKRRYMVGLLEEVPGREKHWFDKLEKKVQDLNLAVGDKIWIKGYYTKDLQGTNIRKFVKRKGFGIIFDNKPMCESSLIIKQGERKYG